jgi:hypothetical protein
VSVLIRYLGVLSCVIDDNSAIKSQLSDMGYLFSHSMLVFF